MPAAPTLQSVTANGLLVVVRWSHADWRPSYRLEAGSGPGLSDLATIDLPSYYSEYHAFPVPPGTYHVRVRAIIGTEISPPSNEIAVTVAGCPPSPPTPTLTGGVQPGQTVLLSWVYNFPTGCAPDYAQVEAGLSPGATDVGAFPVVGWSGVTYQDVPFGTYYVRVRLVRNGVAGAASNELTLSLGCTPPPAIVNARAEVVGNAARFSWQYSGSTTTDFTVFIEAGLSVGGAELGSIAAPRDANAGFNASGPAGTYYTRLRAVSVCGSTVSSEMPVTLTSACPVPDPIPFVDATLGVATPLTVSWQPPSAGGLVNSYRVEVGSAPGQSDLASRVVDGRWVPSFGFSESIGGTFPSRVYLRVTPMNSCGAGPRSIEAHANAACIASPLSGGSVGVNGRRVSMGWGSPSEFDPIQTFIVEIGTRPYGTDVLISPELTSVYPSGPSYSVELPPGRYYARARRLYSGCNERSNPSRELTFEIPGP